MTGKEVRNEIIKYNKIIEGNISLTTFVLNRRVQEAQREIERLRTICPHEYDELGFCIYCDKEKD